MVVQCLENNGTDPLTNSCRWMHEGADLRWYVWGCVHTGTVHQKHNVTWLTRVFSVLTDEDRKTLTLGLLFLVVIQERCLRTHSWYTVRTRMTRENLVVFCFWWSVPLPVSLVKDLCSNTLMIRDFSRDFVGSDHCVTGWLKPWTEGTYTNHGTICLSQYGHFRRCSKWWSTPRRTFVFTLARFQRFTRGSSKWGWRCSPVTPTLVRLRVVDSWIQLVLVNS